MPRFVLCTLGDLLLDVIVRLEQPLEPGTDAAAQTRTGAGGDSDSGSKKDSDKKPETKTAESS